MATKYSEQNIERFAGLEGIRKKPTPYIGPTDSDGLWTILREPADNAVDRALAGDNDLVHIVFDKEPNKYWVIDNGPGIPVGKKEFTDERGRKEKLSTFYVVTGLTHGGGNFSGDTISRGTHGLGIKATNAMSTYFKVWTYRDKAWWAIEYKSGKLVKDVHKTTAPKLPHGLKTTKGTVVSFTPELPMFTKGSKVNLQDVRDWCRLTTYLVDGMRVCFTSASGKTVTLKSEGPAKYIADRVAELGCTQSGKVFLHQSKEADVALAFSDAEGSDLVQAYTNGLRNKEGGEHVRAIQDALFKSLKPYVKLPRGSKKVPFTPTDLRDGLIGLVNYKISAPKFNNQPKDKLIDDRVYPIASAQFLEALTEFWSKNKQMAKDVCARATQLRDKTSAFLKDKKLIKNVGAASKTMSTKLAGVVGKSPIEQREIFLVEGDSAGGGAKRARNKAFQAVYPCRGKPLNVMEAAQDKINKNAEVVGLLAAFGVDMSGKKKGPASIQYGKVIGLADPDVDGPLRGDTRVLTLDGKRPTIASLAESWERNQKPFWVYSRTASGELVPALAQNPRAVAEVQQMAVLSLDKGTPIRCTPNHKWKLLNPKKTDQRIIWYKGCAYVATRDLKPGDSLDSLYLGLTNADGNSVDSQREYLSILGDPSCDKATKPVHRWVVQKLRPKEYAKYERRNKNSGNGGALHIHHLNDRSLDNRPRNLELLSRVAHRSTHGRELALAYNGSAKHKQDLSRFYKSKAGQKFKLTAKERRIAYNKSDAHKAVVGQLNKDEAIKKLQALGKLTRFYLTLKAHNIPCNRDSWDKYRPSSVCTWNTLRTRYTRSQLEDFAFANSLTESDGYVLVEREKQSYPTQMTSKFLSICAEVTASGKTLSQKTYAAQRQTRNVRGDPKWVSVKDRLGLTDKTLVDFVRASNHKVVSVKIVKCKPTPVYCMTVPKTGNFMVDDGEGNGVCSANSHINCLWLTLIYKYLPHLFKQGCVYIAKIPLYKTRHKNVNHFGHTKAGLAKKLGVPESKLEFTYLKGLGEINETDLADVAFDPAKRTLYRVTPFVDKKGETNFKMLMGKSPVYRKKLFGVQ